MYQMNMIKNKINYNEIAIYYKFTNIYFSYYSNTELAKNIIFIITLNSH